LRTKPRQASAAQIRAISGFAARPTGASVPPGGHANSGRRASPTSSKVS
jgi:hypothetical protein